MLVLSRTEGEGLTFPELDLAIQVLRVQGSRVQIGVKAAAEIRVLRSELVGHPAKSNEMENAEAKQTLQNRLRAASMALSISQKHLERGDILRAEMALRTSSVKLRSNSVPFDESTIDNQTADNPNITTTQKRTRILLFDDNPLLEKLLAEFLDKNQIEYQVVRNDVDTLRFTAANLECGSAELALVEST